VALLQIGHSLTRSLIISSSNSTLDRRIIILTVNINIRRLSVILCWPLGASQVRKPTMMMRATFTRTRDSILIK